MKLSKILIFRIFFILVISPLFLNVPKANAAEEIKITYSIFSRTIKVNSLKTFAKEGKSTRKLKRILNATGSPDQEIRTVLNKDFEVPITIASKLVYSEIGNVFLTRLSSIIHPPRATDERTGMLALRASVIQGINIGNGKITKIKNILNFKNLLSFIYIFAPATILTSLTTPFSVTFFAIFIPISFV